MIAKLIKGKGFRGALEYAMQKDKGYLLETNMAGEDPRTLAAEFGQVRALRPNLGKAVCHVAISLPPNEKLTDEQWKDVARTYLKHMEYTDSQYVAVRHTDSNHSHIHIIANRITMNGKVVSDRHDYKRQEVVMRRLEKTYELTQVRSSEKTLRKAPTKGEIEHSLRTGKASTRHILQKAVNNAIRGSPDYTEFANRLEKNGITAIPNMASTGRVSGISFKFEKTTMKGSSLGRGYTWKALQKRGLNYEQDRDNAEIIRGRERGKERPGSKNRTPSTRNERAGLLQSAKLQRDYATLEASTRNDRKDRHKGPKRRKQDSEITR